MRNRMHFALGTMVVGFSLLSQAQSQVSADLAQPSDQSHPSPSPWSYSVNVAGYLVPNDVSYASPTFAADHEWIHVEARYNYEALQTASLWAGYNLSAGDKIALSLTPMLGAVFGDTNGIAPGYELSLTWRKIELTSDGEYLFAPSDGNQSFFYSWDELVYSPTDWIHAGLVAQRTRVYQTGLDVQRGFSVGLAHKNADFTVYTFNAGWTDPTIVLNLNWKF